jgi:CBS domain-containing protein
MGEVKMNIAKYIMLTGCTRFPSKKIGIEPQTNGREIADKLTSTRLPGVPVIDNRENNKVIGVVTEYNLLGALREGMDPEKFTAERIMEKNPITVEPDTPAEELIEIMLEHNFTMLPITKNNKLFGVIDRCSILDFYMTSSYGKYAVKT